MKLRKFIQRSNSQIVLLSLLALFVVFFSSITYFSVSLLNTIESDEIINSEIFEVKVILENYTSDDLFLLDQALRDVNYDLIVYRDDLLLYTNISPLSKDLNGFLLRDVSDDNYALFHRGNWTIVRKNLTDENMKIFAVHSSIGGSENLARTQFFFNYLIYFLIIGLLSIVLLMIISRWFTNKMLKKVMVPVNLLMDGVHRVENNDLTQDINYQGDDEFAELCTKFNEMQGNLHDEMMKNTAYDKARTDMISGISHDLRTPLTSIKGFLQGMKEGVANTEEKKEKYLDICYKKANEMDELLKQLYYYSKVETKVMPFHFEAIDIGRMLHHLVESKKADITCGASIEYIMPQEAMMCQIDPDQFYRVFVNIIDNSFKYAQRSNLEITIQLHEQDDDYCIIFADNGVGMSEEKLDYVFNQFYRGDEYRNNQIDGSGLGLYLSREIIHRHGGSIRADNDNGFKVTIVMPREGSD